MKFKPDLSEGKLIQNTNYHKIIFKYLMHFSDNANFFFSDSYYFVVVVNEPLRMEILSMKHV